MDDGGKRKSKEIKERKTETERDMKHTDLRSFVYSAYSMCISATSVESDFNIP